MDSRKKLGQMGFTLVEVIVVAVIVAILAGVSIPLYNGYVNSSRANQAANAAGSAASFMGACFQSQGTPTLADGAEVVGDGTHNITCDIPNTADDPSIVVPSGFTIHRVGNAIRGRHNTVAVGGDGESAPFAFPATAAAAGGGAGAGAGAGGGTP
jgi:prepilin-type N-terminal cleavage/methylation domain-containing protein